MRRGSVQRAVWCVVGSLVWCGGAPAWAAKKEDSKAPMPQRVRIDPSVIQAIEALSEKDPAIALRVYYVAAEGYQAQHQSDQALAIYEAAAKAFPQQEEALNRLVGLYQSQAKHDQVIEVAGRLAQLHPGNASYQQLIANAQFAKGDTAAGLAVWDALAAAHADDATLQLQFAQTLQAYGKPQEALQRAEAAATLKPQDVGILQQVGQLYLANQQWDHAQELYEELLRSAKEPWVQRDAGRQLVSIAMQQKTLEAFLARVTAGLAKNPADLNAHWQLIEGYSMAGEPEALAEALERAVKQFPDDQDLRWRLINAYQAQGTWDQVVAILGAMAAKQPQDNGLKMQLAQAHASAGQFKEAVAVLGQAAQAEPNNPAYAEQIAEIYVRANQLGEAIERYNALEANATEEWRKANYASRIEQLTQQRAATHPAPTAAEAAAPASLESHQAPAPATASGAKTPAKKKRR